MSGNKVTDVKSTIDDLDVDSGFQSGLINVLEEDSGCINTDDSEFRQETAEEEHQKYKEIKPQQSEEKVSCADILDMDSGVVKDDVSYLARVMTEVKLVDIDTTETSAQSVRPQSKDLPVDLLFQQDDDGDTQLHIAAVHGYEKPVSTLIRVCPEKQLLNLCNDYGETALHLAVMSRNPIVTRMLVLAGADIGIRDRRGETPLHKATSLSDVKCIQALLMPVHEHQRKISPILNQKNYNGQACVHVAARQGQIDSLQTLLFYGADINSRENMAGWTALHIAASRGDLRLVQYLQRCNGVDPRAQDYAGRTPRRLARVANVAALFVRHDDSESDTDDDDDMYDEEIESLFEKYSSQSQSIVA